jgi:hypothetical protein
MAESFPTVLIIEDDAPIRLLYRTILTANRFQV